MIVGISGKMGSGKDTIADIIQALTYEGGRENIGFAEDLMVMIINRKSKSDSEWEIKKYADKLKYITSILIGCSRIEIEDQEFKATPLGEEWDYLDKDGVIQKRTPREILQLIGTEGGRNLIHKDIWVNAMFSNYKSGSKANGEKGLPSWIITDVRFFNELVSIKKRGGITIRVNRINTGKELSLHSSETALDDAEGFDYTIDNNGSLGDLISKTEKILQSEGLI